MKVNVFDPNNAKLVCESVNSDPEFKLAARYVSLNLALGIGLEHNNKEILVQIHDGQLVKFEPVDSLWMQNVDISIKATEEFWGEFLEPKPIGQFHSLNAGQMRGHLVISGNAELRTAYAWAISRLMTMLRLVNNQGTVENEDREYTFKMGTIEPLIGRYIHLEVEGIGYRVYYEENGQGIPLLCQHTAGSDGQQFRRLIADPDITKKYRVIVYDLPYHGKSQPPRSIKWWAQDYMLREKWVIAFHEAFHKALGLSKSAFIGCSMGGQMAFDLALHASHLYRAAIGLGGSLDIPGFKISPYSRHPRVNMRDSQGVLMQDFSSPNVLEANRWEIAWNYSLGGPGISNGDSFYWGKDHNVRETVKQIDSSSCAVYIMNGEYDYGTTIDRGEEAASMNQNIKFIPMYGLGHFSIIEDFPTLKEKYLMSVLDEIAALDF